MSPPLTGASSIVAPSDTARSAKRLAVLGAMVLVSIRIVPGCIALKTPSGPSSTNSTSGESGTIVKIRVARRATSAGDDALRAPAATRSSTGPGLRLLTTRGKPALSRFLAMGRPMRPSPINPTVSIIRGSIVRADGPRPKQEVPPQRNVRARRSQASCPIITSEEVTHVFVTIL